MFEEHRGLILACDVGSLDQLSSLAQLSKHAAEIVGFKVGFSLALRFGLPRVVEHIRAHSTLPIIYDHQKAGTDIPQMGRPFASACSDAGVGGVIVFPHSGPKTLEAFVDSAFEADLTPIVGLAMTHPAYLESEGGFIADDAPKRICEIALRSDVRAFVLPGTKLDTVEHFSAGPLGQADASILMPGIGSQGGSLSAAFKAASPCRRYAIIGSAIYSAPDPPSAVETFAREMMACEK